MFKTTKLILGCFIFYTLASCSQVLQSVDLSINSQDTVAQDEFNVIEKTLTLTEAINEQNSPYPRRVFENGQSGRARHISEELALKSSFPDFSKPAPYKIGIGDTLTISRLVDNNVKTEDFNKTWPLSNEMYEYKMGTGDSLALIRLVENSQQTAQSIDGNQAILAPHSAMQQTTKSISRIGSDGSVLLLEVGRLEAKEKTLNELRSEVRNIFIRNGISPRFQLEIEGFTSKQVFLTINELSQVITLTDKKLFIREMLTRARVGIKPGVITTVKLQRGGEIYSADIRQIYDVDFPDIQLKNQDHIFVEDSISEDEQQSVQVSSDGTVILKNLGQLTAKNKTLEELTKEILQIRDNRSSTQDIMQLELTQFDSKQAIVRIGQGADSGSTHIEFISNRALLLNELLTKIGITFDNTAITRITLHRANKKYQFSLFELFNHGSKNIYVMANDEIRVEKLLYRPNKVFVLGGINPQIIKIDPTTRQTLADILFAEGGVLKSSNAKRSEIYLLRYRNPIMAYHLNARSPTRLIVAEAMELRPNDILYVAEQPIISFNRTLATIIPLRSLLRDIQEENIP